MQGGSGWEEEDNAMQVAWEELAGMPRRGHVLMIALSRRYALY